LVIRGAFDHAVGVYAFNYSLADFQVSIDQNIDLHETNIVQRIEILYPFVDLLNDGYSSFAYNGYLLLSNNNTIAIVGAEADGTIVAPSTFLPDLEAYAYAPTVATSTGEIYLDAYTNLSSTQPSVTTRFKTLEAVGPWPLNL
jgi:hypothetical protein